MPYKSEKIAISGTTYDRRVKLTEGRPETPKRTAETEKQRIAYVHRRKYAESAAENFSRIAAKIGLMCRRVHYVKRGV